MGEPPVKRHCSQVTRNGQTVRVATPGGSSGSGQTQPLDDDDFQLTQDQLRDIDRQVQEAEERKSRHSESVIHLEEKVKRGAGLFLAHNPSPPQRPTTSTAPEEDTDMEILARTTNQQAQADTQAKFLAEIETIKKKLEKKEQELMTKEGELTILRIHKADSEREKSKIWKEMGVQLDKEKEEFHKLREEDARNIKNLQDQLKFAEMEKKELERRLSRVQDEAQSQMSQSVVEPTFHPPPLPDAGGRRVLTAANRSGNTPSGSSAAQQGGSRQRRSRGSLGPDKKSFFQDEVPSSQVVASQSSPVPTPPPPAPAQSSPPPQEEDSSIVAFLDDGEILARLASNLKHVSLNPTYCWTKYKEDRHKRVIVNLNLKTLKSCRDRKEKQPPHNGGNA